MKKILITGAAGTIGSELIEQLLESGKYEIIVIDNAESEIFYINEKYRNEERVRCLFADIRDYNRLLFLCNDVDCIIHAAALKHVEISELSPLDAVQTNINGTSNVIRAALASESVTRVIYTSSDKAVNPTNVMGTTKLLGERMITSAMNIGSSKHIVFSSTRFGNVLGSKGSVVPLFVKQIRNGGPLTLTDSQMTRFIMTINEAAKLVLEATDLAKGGEVFVTKMPVIRILDLAHVMIEALANSFGYKHKDIQIEEIGARPGEKLFEELMTHEEISRAVELDKHFVISPAVPLFYKKIDYKNYAGNLTKIVKSPYTSSNEKYLSRSEIGYYLESHRILAPYVIGADL